MKFSPFVAIGSLSVGLASPPAPAGSDLYSQLCPTPTAPPVPTAQMQPTATPRNITLPVSPRAGEGAEVSTPRPLQFDNSPIGLIGSQSGGLNISLLSAAKFPTRQRQEAPENSPKEHPISGESPKPEAEPRSGAESEGYMMARSNNGKAGLSPFQKVGAVSGTAIGYGTEVLGDELFLANPGLKKLDCDIRRGVGLAVQGYACNQASPLWHNDYWKNCWGGALTRFENRGEKCETEYEADVKRLEREMTPKSERSTPAAPKLRSKT